MSDEVKTAKDIAQDYTDMGEYIDLMNGIIEGSQMREKEADERKSGDD